jgi:hypothetical protein
MASITQLQFAISTPSLRRFASKNVVSKPHTQLSHGRLPQSDIKHRLTSSSYVREVVAAGMTNVEQLLFVLVDVIAW